MIRIQPNQEPELYQRWLENDKIVKIKDKLLGIPENTFETAQETTTGNNLNAKLGNIIFQPYVKIEDYALNEETDF